LKIAFLTRIQVTRIQKYLSYSIGRRFAQRQKTLTAQRDMKGLIVSIDRQKRHGIKPGKGLKME
jgi:hypothetical protein